MIPIAEPRVLGEVLKDPGFENHLTITGGGPLGNELPYYNETFNAISDYLAADVPPVWCFPALTWSDKTCAPTTGWGTDFRRGWQLSSVGPEAGTYHLRLKNFTTMGSGPHYIYPLTGQSCRKRARMYAARVTVDDILTWKMKFRLVNHSSGGVPFVVTVITWFDSTFTAIPFTDYFSPNQSLTSTYTEYTWSQRAPYGAYYAQVLSRLHYNNPNGTCQVDADSASLVVVEDG